MEPVVVGVDLGGTIVRGGAITSQGELRALKEVAIQAHHGPEAGLARITELIDDAVGEANGTLLGIGIGCTGPLDVVRGVIQNPFTLPTWEDVPVLAQLESAFNVPVSLENDADTAALGEYWLGAGRGVSRLYAVTVGTGIGAAFVQDGQILRGLNSFHPEGGHQVIDPNGPLCYCGSRGCLESLASGPAIARQAQQALPDFPDTCLLQMAHGDPERIDARMVAQAARLGDSLALGVVDRAAHYLSLGLVNVVMLFMPEALVLSGGVMKSADLFIPAIQRAMESISGYVPSLQMRILQAQLGYYAGMYGAAYTIIQKLRR